jgi:hypothetical protein
MSAQTIASLRASKNRMRAALDKVAVHADSFASEAEAMANVSGDTFSGAGEAMKAIVQEITEVREIFDLGGNGGPPLDSPTAAPAKGSGAPATTSAGSSVKTEITALGPVQRVIDNPQS